MVASWPGRCSRAAGPGVRGRYRPGPGRRGHRVRPQRAGLPVGTPCCAVRWPGRRPAVIKRLGSVDLLRLSAPDAARRPPLSSAEILTEHRPPPPSRRPRELVRLLIIPATAVNFVLWFGLLSATPTHNQLALLDPRLRRPSPAPSSSTTDQLRVAAGGVLVVAGVLLTQRQASQKESSSRRADRRLPGGAVPGRGRPD